MLNEAGPPQTVQPEREQRVPAALERPAARRAGDAPDGGEAASTDVTDDGGELGPEDDDDDARLAAQVYIYIYFGRRRLSLSLSRARSLTLARALCSLSFIRSRTRPSATA